MDDIRCIIDRLKARFLLRRAKLIRKKIIKKNPQKVLTTDINSDIILMDGNDQHLPAGTPEGGQFTEKTASEKLADRLKGSSYEEKLDRKKQRYHLADAQEYKDALASGVHKSVIKMTESEIASHLPKWRKNGIPIEKNDGSIRVIVRDPNVDGFACSEDGTNPEKTNWLSVNYSKSGVHVFPIKAQDAQRFVQMAKANKKKILEERKAKK
jgi:hypothetical protein